MNPEENEELFAVLAADERLPDFAVVSKVMAEALGLNRDDSNRAARHAWGVIGEDFSGAKAVEIIERCAVYGLKAVKIPAGLFRRPPAPLDIKAVSFSEGKLSYSTAANASASAEPSSISLLAAAPVRSTATRTVTEKQGPSAQERAVRLGIMAATGLPIGMGRSKEVKKEITGSETAFYMDIVLKTGGTHLRLNSDRFDFSCLKEKKTYSSQMNFRLLCRTLSDFTPSALKNAGMFAILEGGPLAALPYDTLDDLETEVLRLSAIAH